MDRITVMLVSLIALSVWLGFALGYCVCWWRMRRRVARVAIAQAHLEGKLSAIEARNNELAERLDQILKDVGGESATDVRVVH